ncbi:MAG: HAMP domain-containing sensor histidine kinase [Peptoniphilaceae bacterium]|nr:HAMP domain-containing sensor histidine kinase [Peptoniphilaceae bacterium]
MKNLKIFLSTNKAYLISLLAFTLISLITSYVFPIDRRVFAYSLFLLYVFIFSIMIVRFVKIKKILKEDKFAYFNHDPYEIYLEDMLKKKDREIGDIKLYARKNHEDLDNLLSIWTHQIKTPLAAISLISQREENFDIDKELVRIDDYIASLLSMLKLRGNSIDYNFKSFSIEKLIRDVVKRYRHFFIGKNLSLKLDIEDKNIVSDPKWLGFVLEQVLFNAIKYTDKGYIQISYKDDILQIEDTGIGIKKEDLKNIDKFGYSGDSDRRNPSSTGIGLYLVNDILTKLGYSYKIDSELNKGTRFSINLSRNKLIED